MKAALSNATGSHLNNIAFVLAVVLMVTGLYTAGPWYASTSTSALALAFENPWARGAVGAFYAFSGVYTLRIIGIKKNPQPGAFFMAISFMFATVLRILVIGALPLIWMHILACGLVSGILYVSYSLKDEGDE